MKHTSKKQQWQQFAYTVSNFIDYYVLPQYGDYPDQHIDEMSVEEIKGKLSSYVQRIGKVQFHRGLKGAKEDLYKIAHFCCYLNEKFNNEFAEE